MMILRKGDHFIEALKMQRIVSEELYKTKNKHVKKRLEQEYKNVTASIQDYVDNMNAHGERDDV